jgi:cytosine/adenosine deaminase-related metal-dependent hydrolase
MAAPYTIHTSTLFDPKKREFVSNISIKVDPASGLIVDIIERAEGAQVNSLLDGDIDLRGKVVMPGFVDAHTHIFIHSYK